ncbi:hypothetical protein M422DRAFT_75247 [Sphaerobolus stellatus SS14]|uniref:NUC153 domain-containing protein n=1 Tax=Sphaerobolus stellatus (strain SS14) TaxID=990650 RepID=A0A0C9VS27_SPHS4|nr:hypothetical protein M422DRAFT_75247 [Sphaerobolus stellatus SS14]
MSDPRFARIKSDPRFRKPRKKENKVVVDDRFKSVFENDDTKGKGKAKKVDKYGRKVSAKQDTDNLKRFYRLEEDEEVPETTGPDYARGEILMESSSEGEDEEDKADDSGADDGTVILGRDSRKPIHVPNDELEIDLDESQFAELDALAEANLTNSKEEEVTTSGGEQTNRLAVVNLDWDHVKAIHLYKIFSSVLESKGKDKKGSVVAPKGKLLSVKVYPSRFGKERLEKEAAEGPPKEIFKRRIDDDDDDELDDEGKPIIQEDDGVEYDEDALRKYQLERLRYYYAIVTFDTVDASVHAFTELDGTELERSANLFDLSYVPNEMSFDEEVRDEATEDTTGLNFKGVEFVTDALRHSRVKLTWDDDDPERAKITRRALSKKEIEEADFRALIASDSEDEEDGAKRDKMRSLLLGGDDNELVPEGWGKDIEKTGDMEITFTPALSGKKDEVNEENETTLQRYLRKQKEKRKKKTTAKTEVDEQSNKVEDEFFGDDTEDEEEEPADKKHKKKGKKAEKPEAPPRVESTAEELELLVSSVDPSKDTKHFDMRSILKVEKTASKKGRKRDKKKGKDNEGGEDETQQNFSIDVKDDRFTALHEDHSFAIDPTNPHFKKTKSMAALLEERSKRQRGSGKEEATGTKAATEGETERSLSTLVESVKRKASAMGNDSGGKRRKV